MISNIPYKNYLLIALGVIMLLSNSGCSKLVTVDPPYTSLTSGNIYTNDATAASVLTGIYTLMSSSTPLFAASPNSVSLVSGLSADEFTLYGGSANADQLLVQYYLNQLNSGAAGGSSPTIWSNCYSNIYTVNIALENLAPSTSLTPAVKQQLTGEAKFLRAFFYFYLVNLYGNVPLEITSNYVTNTSLPQTSPSLVYKQIIADLVDAENLLGDAYTGSDAMSPSTERVRPNKWAATALLARAYLYNQQWDSAEAASTAVINHTALYQLDSLNGVFLKNSTEAIWQWQPVNTGWNTEDARIFILPPTGPASNSSSGSYPVILAPQLLNSFEEGDLRRVKWVDSVMLNGLTYYYPYKYKSATLNASVTEYLMVLRLGEQYLIRAEARANKNNTGGAQSDLNTIRTRAGLPNTMAGDQTSLLSAILHERQTELFTEWGNRWLDLKRTGNIDGVMNTVAPEKGTSWNTNWQLYPIPLYDIKQNTGLKQNNGY